MPDNLALAFQEILTAIVRVRSNRHPVTDAESFRAQMREALRLADEESRRRGYSAEDAQLARFAMVAFLDESVLNSRNAVFADWPRRPMQDELFGVHVAGETFFQYVDRLLTQPDSPAVADVLEVYDLCLLLGFVGRYSISGKAEIRSVRDRVAQKIRRIRGGLPPISPDWMPQGGGNLSLIDPWVRRLAFGAIGVLTLALLMFFGYKLALNSGASDLRALSIQGTRIQ